MSVRALLGRPAESLLLTLGVALAVGATAAGITLAGTTRAQSEALLASPRYREIVVSTRAETSTMELPARVRTATDVRLTVEDLESARSATEAVQYAYLANPTGFLLGELPFPKGLPESANRAAGTTGAVQMSVIPGASVTKRQADTGDSETAHGATDLAEATSDVAKQLPSAKEVSGMAEMLLTAPEGPKLQLEYLRGLEVTPEFFNARGLMAAVGSLFTEADMVRGEPVLVLGSQLGEDLFEDRVALDRQVLSLNRLYRIVGVLVPTGTDVDGQAFAPARQAAVPMKGFDVIKAQVLDTTLRFTVADPAHLDVARAQLASHFDAAYGEGAVSISIPRAEAVATTDRYRRLVTIILFLALSALTIAAVNMTIIFYSRAVRRRRSVGILKAVGASMGQVFAVFFLEALVVGLAGAAAGMGLAALLSRLMEQTIDFGTLHAGLVIAGVVAAWIIVAAGNVLPAVAAARMPAADAIRYE